MSYLRNHRPSSIVHTGSGHPISSSSSSSRHHRRKINERSLSESDVYLYNVAGDGTCQIRTSLDTLYDGEVAATGVTFSVQALTTSIDIQAFEFANTPGSSTSTINIYARKGTSFSTTASDWVTLASTTSVVSPDGLGMITPRADMKQALTIAAGEAWTIYIASSSTNIKLASTTTSTGSSYQVDDFLQLNVGESMTDGDEFSASRAGNRGFQGKLHYRVLKPCKELTTETELTFPFATASGIDRSELNDAVTSGFNKLLTEEADLKRWTEVYGLSINNITFKSQGPAEDCSEYGLQGGCDLYASEIVFGHFKSLASRDVVLEFLLKLNFRDGLGNLGNGINVTYIGNEVLQQQYDVTLTGVPSGTVLNPIQRDYLQHVTLDFFDKVSESVPNRVTIQHSTEKRRHLRSRDSSFGGSQSRGSRSLEAGGVVEVEALVYGIGKDHDAFFKELEKAFLSNTKQYREEVQRQQYLPGEINDGKNFGAIFEDITDVKVVRSQASEPTLPPTTGTSSKDKLDSSQIQIIVFSILIAITFSWLVYRILKDCVLVQDGWAVKKEKLSDKVERDKDIALNRPELSYMDKPRQRTSVVIDISSLPEIKLPADDSSVPPKASSDRASRRAPTNRGIGATKSSDDLDILRPRSNLGAGAPREPTRGVRRAKSNDADLLFESLSANTVKSNHSQGEPVRGVARSKSSDNANFLRLPPRFGFAPSPVEPGKAAPPIVARSKSNDLLDMADTQRLASPAGKSKSKSKPSSAKKKSKKSKKENKDLQSDANTGTSSQDKKGSKKPKSVKKKRTGTGGESAASPSSPRKRADKEKSKENKAVDEALQTKKKTKTTRDVEDRKMKKSKKSTKPPKTTETSG